MNFSTPFVSEHDPEKKATAKAAKLAATPGVADGERAHFVAPAAKPPRPDATLARAEDVDCRDLLADAAPRGAPPPDPAFDLMRMLRGPP